MTAVFVVVVIVLLARIHNLDDKVESMISLAYEAATASQQKSDLAINLKDNNDDDPELDHDVAEVHKKLADLHSLVTSSSIGKYFQFLGCHSVCNKTTMFCIQFPGLVENILRPGSSDRTST